MTTEGASPSTLIQGIITDLQTLIREEIRLARAEIQDIVNDAKEGAPLLAGGGGMAGVGGLLLVIALAEFASDILGGKRWAGFGVVGLIFAGIGYALLQSGRAKLQHTHLVPEQTIQTMQDNVDWLKDRAVGDGA